MNSYFIIKGKCLICHKKSSPCKQLICEIFETKSIFLLTSKLRIDSEKFNKVPEKNRLICVECYEILYEFYKKVEKQFYDNTNLTLNNEVDAELRKVLCCLCKQHKKVLKPIELNIWMYNQKLINKRFATDFEVEDTACPNACLNCYNHLLFLATVYNTTNDIPKKSKLETLSEEQEILVPVANEPRQGTSATKKKKSLEVIELYRRNENEETTSSSCHFLMVDQIKSIEKEKAEANQNRFSKFWRRIIKRSSTN